MNFGGCHGHQFAPSRRDFLRKSSFGFGAAALGHLLAEDAAGATGASNTLDPLAPKPAHFPAKAKSVIFIFLQGGPSQVDTFDPKPTLTKFDGKTLSSSFQGVDLDFQFIKASEARL